MKALTASQMREADRLTTDRYGVPSLQLMENAGAAIAEYLWNTYPDLHTRLVFVLCGKGNNGGDGFVIARHLDNREIAVRVLLFARPDQLTGDAAINCRIIEQTGIPLMTEPDTATLTTTLAQAAWIVDALFGTGLTGAVRPPLDGVIGAINSSGKPVLAVDIPSGLDCDTGLPLGATVRAAHTVTFVAPKIGFAQPAAREWLGQVHVVDIGAPRAALPAS
jgi:NAD(P)H-hydrate epimerase